jgi:hypothetical protein
MARCMAILQTSINVKGSNMNDILYDKWNKKLGNLRNLNAKHEKTNIQTNNFSTLIKNFTHVTFNNEETEIHKLGLNYPIDKPVTQYIQDLIIDTENATTHLDTKILIALAHKKLSQILNSDTTNISHRRQLHVIKQIHRKLIKYN